MRKEEFKRLVGVEPGSSVRFCSTLVTTSAVQDAYFDVFDPSFLLIDFHTLHIPIYDCFLIGA